MKRFASLFVAVLALVAMVAPVPACGITAVSYGSPVVAVKAYNQSAVVAVSPTVQAVTVTAPVQVQTVQTVQTVQAVQTYAAVQPTVTVTSPVVVATPFYNSAVFVHQHAVFVHDRFFGHGFRGRR